MGKCEIVVVICFHDFLELEQPVAQIFVSYNLMNGRPRSRCWSWTVLTALGQNSKTKKWGKNKFQPTFNVTV